MIHRKTIARALLFSIVLAGAAFAASGAQAASSLDAWNYTISQTRGGCMGFQYSPDSSGCSWARGAMPFGSPNHECDLAEPATYWPVNTDLFVWREIYVPLPGRAITFSWTVDNDIEIYVNGESSARSQHGFCGLTGSSDAIPLQLGANKIAIHAADYGVLTHLNVTYTIT